MSKLITMLEDVSKKRAELSKQMISALQEGIAEFMKEHPSIKAIGWTQFTPYFNDGDTCTFSVGEIYGSMNENPPEDFYDDDLDGGWFTLNTYSVKNIEGLSPSEKTELVEFAKALSKAEDDLQAAFGDHVKVIIKQDGIDVEDYEHE
jgi:hypothetical protein